MRPARAGDDEIRERRADRARPARTCRTRRRRWRTAQSAARSSGCNPGAATGSRSRNRCAPSSVVTQTAGASRIARRPYFAPSHPRHNVNNAGNSDEIRDEQRRHHHADRRSSIRRTARRRCRSSTPCRRNIPGRRRTPAGTRGRAETPASCRWISNSGTMSGASAIHANIGMAVARKAEGEKDARRASARIRAASPGRVRAGAAILRHPRHQAAEK